MADPRRPLTHVQGEEHRFGDPAAADALAGAFYVDESEEDDPVHGVHGLAPYPARLHPAWARKLLPLCPGETLLDPFCGSGTVLVEAMRTGRTVYGTDLNEVALRIARQRTARPDDGWLDAFQAGAEKVHGLAAHRRESHLGVLAKDERAFPPHVLTQLINLRTAIEEEPEPSVREALLVLMGGLLGKFAARAGRPAPEVNRRAARDHFLRRCELAYDAWLEHRELVPDGIPDARLKCTDARRTGLLSHSIDAVITSPPYPGVYDYVAEQERRAAWMGSTAWIGPARKGEIGRRGSPAGLWVRSMDAVLGELARVTRRGAAIFLVVGDGVAGDEVVRVDQVVRRLLHTRKLPLSRVAMVSHDRPHFHGPTRELFADRARREHLIQLERR